jgi:2-(1,2-epoxy-1,2-dihydrophenyl)acetyl-CoA isomerase
MCLRSNQLKDTILVTRRNHLVTLTFNRPEKMNACNRDMGDDLEQLCEEIKSDESVHVVLLQGAGECFMVGSDLYELNRDIETFSGEALSLVRQFNSCVLMLREMEKIVVASVHGRVIGTGMGLMLASDLVVASDNTKFSLGFNRVAVSPTGAVSYLLPRTVGTKRSLELLFMPEVLDAPTALSFGLINWVVPHAERANKTEQVLDNLLRGPIIALNQTKQLINSSYQNKLTAQLEFEAESFVRCANTQDFKTAIQAFVNKHLPEFEGK